MKDLNNINQTNYILKHFHNPFRTNDNVVPNLPHFTVNIPLETDEILIDDHQDIEYLNIDESSPMRIMSDKRKLLASQPTTNMLISNNNININNISSSNNNNNINPNIDNQPISSSIMVGDTNKIVDHTENITTTRCLDVDDYIMASSDIYRKYNDLNSTPPSIITYIQHSDYHHHPPLNKYSYTSTDNDINVNIHPYHQSNNKNLINKSKSVQDISSNYGITSNDNHMDNNSVCDTFNIMNPNMLITNNNKNHSDSSSPSADTNTIIDNINNNPNNSDSNDNFIDQIARIYITERPTPRDPDKTKPCNCQKTGCLKLYCECFARGDSCFNCSCKCCLNTPNDYEHWLKASNLVKSRRKTLLAMAPKNGNTNKLRRGCNCRRSLCLKKYCECFDKKIPCTKYCRCIDCCNGGTNQNTRKTHQHHHHHHQHQHHHQQQQQQQHQQRLPSNKNNHPQTPSTETTAISVTNNGQNSTHNEISQNNPSYSDTYSSENDFSKIRNKHQGISDRVYQQQQNDIISQLPSSYNPTFNMNSHMYGHNPSRSLLHASQSSNDLISNSKNSLTSHYSKSSSTPNLLSTFSINIKSERSSGAINDYSASDAANNKQMMNRYLNLIANNPATKE